jgi:HEPN domain
LRAPTPEQREYAELLLEHATSDLGACRVLMAAQDMRDDVVGFHAQQAVEKSLKVVLVLADVDFPRSHDLRELVDIATDNEVAVPGSDRAGALADTVGGTTALRDAGASRSPCGLLNGVRRRRVGDRSARGLIGPPFSVSASSGALGFAQTPNAHIRFARFGFIEPRTNEKTTARRGRDSNPRTRSTPVTRFPVAPVQPLRHLSVDRDDRLAPCS